MQDDPAPPGARAGHGAAPALGIVVIGRNEGERLKRSLASLRGAGLSVVYVDSASTDGSVAAARALGAEVVELPLDIPFTAGRARNAGFERLYAVNPDLLYAQFIDGDCELEPGWLDCARDFLDTHPDVVIVCGRRQERYPERSWYNRLCDLEWNTPVGYASACGGDFMIRADAYAAVGGFNEGLIAGEEPDLCHRLTANGWRIYRADHLMTHHDAAITRIDQWARRLARGGYAYAAGAALHWRDGRRYWWKENARIIAWAFALPSATLLLAAWWSPGWLLLLLAYPVQYARTVAALRRQHPTAPAARWAAFLMLGKWPEFYGQCLFTVRALRGLEQRIIEYK